MLVCPGVWLRDHEPIAGVAGDGEMLSLSKGLIAWGEDNDLVDGCLRSVLVRSLPERARGLGIYGTDASGVAIISFHGTMGAIRAFSLPVDEPGTSWRTALRDSY